MKKKSLIISVVVGIFIVLAGGLGIYLLNQEKPSGDALKFKEEYESLNGTIRESDGQRYNDIKIDKNNPIVYIDSKGALEELEENQAIIYVGANWCPWCRGAVPVLLEVAEEYKVDKIYYLDLDNEKSSFEIVDGELNKTKDGSANYYKLLEKLGDRLSDYALTKDGKSYPTGEKRIYMPYVVGVKNGKVSKDLVGTVSLNENQTKYDNLSDEQQRELKDKYIEIFESVYGKQTGSCDENVCY